METNYDDYEKRQEKEDKESWDRFFIQKEKEEQEQEQKELKKWPFRNGIEDRPENQAYLKEQDELENEDPELMDLNAN